MTIVPRLVKDTETGAICIQVLMGSHSATLPLPAEMEGASSAAIQGFMDRMVPQMIEGLLEEKAKERRQLMKEAQKQ